MILCSLCLCKLKKVFSQVKMYTLTALFESLCLIFSGQSYVNLDPDPDLRSEKYCNIIANV